MKAEEAAKWMDMLCERSLKMDESGKFDQVAALIRAQAEEMDSIKADLRNHPGCISLPPTPVERADEISRLRAEVERWKNVHCADTTVLRMRVAARDVVIEAADRTIAKLWVSIGCGAGHPRAGHHRAEAEIATNDFRRLLAELGGK